jgi:hypothetical protein
MSALTVLQQVPDLDQSQPITQRAKLFDTVSPWLVIQALVKGQSCTQQI